METERLGRGSIAMLLAGTFMLAAVLYTMWGRERADASLPRCDDLVAKANAKPHDPCRETWR